MHIRTATVVGILTVAAGLDAHAQSIDRTTFTASIHETFYRYPAGEQFKTRDLTVAVAATGLQIEARHLVNPAGQGVEQRIILDPVGPTRVVVDGLTESLTTTRYTSKPVTCTNDAAPKHSTILGYDVVESIDVRNESGETWRTESWTALALDCFPLRVATYIGKTGGSAVLTSVREAASVVVGQPAASLFEIPAGYTERAPSQSPIFRPHHAGNGFRAQRSSLLPATKEVTCESEASCHPFSRATPVGTATRRP